MPVDLEQLSKFGACDDRIDRAAAADNRRCVCTAQRLIQGAARCAQERDDGIGELRWEIIEVVDGKQPIDVPKALEYDSRCSLVKLKQASRPIGQRSRLGTEDV